MKKIVVAVAFFSLMACGVKKDLGLDFVSLEFRFGQHYNSPIPVNIFIYNTLSDYGTNKNAVVSGRTDANGQFKLSYSKLEKGKKYYIDWYSDDFSYNNWTGKTEDNTLIFRQFDGISRTLDSPNDGDGFRRMYVNDPDTETNWKAIDFLAEGQSNWSKLSENDQFKRIKFKKDFTGVFTEKNDSGELVLHNFTFTPQYRQITPSFSNWNEIVTIDKLSDNPATLSVVIFSRTLQKWKFIRE